MYNCEKLKAFVTDIMIAAGLPETDSRMFAESLIEADMRGISSHGITRLAAYSRRVNEGMVNVSGEITVEACADTVLKVHGNNCMGVVSAGKAMQLCIERAAKHGSCFAAINGGNHFGAAAFYTQMAARANMIGICVSNAPPAVAPIGGKTPFLGTNPLSISVPAGKYRPLVLDMATSVVARGKVRLAEKKKESIPNGWGVDKNGRPTTDPGEVLNGGAVLPFGGAKGFAISLIIEILCACLAGGMDSRHLGSFYDYSGCEQKLGFFVGAIDVSKIVPSAEFCARVDEMFDELKAQPRGEGVQEIFIPGEIEFNNYRHAQENGINISEAVKAELEELAKKYNVRFDCAQE